MREEERNELKERGQKEIIKGRKDKARGKKEGREEARQEERKR